MISSAPDSRVFRESFSTAAMRRIFSDQRRTQYYLGQEPRP